MTGEKFMSELHLKQLGFICRARGTFTKHHGRVQNIRETGNLKHLFRNELDRACFAYDPAYYDSKELAKGTILDKILKDRGQS